jgi:hypothetical protein
MGGREDGRENECVRVWVCVCICQGPFSLPPSLSISLSLSRSRSLSQLRAPASSPCLCLPRRWQEQARSNSKQRESKLAPGKSKRAAATRSPALVCKTESPMPRQHASTLRACSLRCSLTLPQHVRPSLIPHPP